MPVAVHKLPCIVYSHCTENLEYLQVADVVKSKSQTSLGISVVSTAEGKDPSRHFICNILPEGAVGKTGLIRVNDELLAVSVMCFSTYRSSCQSITFISACHM